MGLKLIKERQHSEAEDAYPKYANRLSTWPNPALCAPYTLEGRAADPRYPSAHSHLVVRCYIGW